MNLDEAIEVLNRRRHRDSDQWHVVKNLRMVRVTPHPDAVSHAWLTEFEVVAIAEKYEREGGKGDGS